MKANETRVEIDDCGCVFEENVWRCLKCKEEWVFDVDGPLENQWKFCPACGRRILYPKEAT